MRKRVYISTTKKLKSKKMFNKAMNFMKKTAKKAASSERLKTMALMLLVGSGVAMAQNSAGDYSAGTTALTTVTEEIAKYVPIVVKLCYAIAGVVAVVGAISVYIAIDNGSKSLVKTERKWNVSMLKTAYN